MKHIFSFIILSVIGIFSIFANNIYTLSLQFNRRDFTWSLADTTYYVKSQVYNINYSEDSTTRALPLLTSNILLPPNSKVDSVKCVASHPIVFAIGELGNNPTISPNNYSCASDIGLSNHTSQGSSIPIENHLFSCDTYNYGQYCVANICYTPFEYIESCQRLNISESLSLQVYYSSTSNTTSHSIKHKEFVREIVSNPSDLSFYQEWPDLYDTVPLLYPDYLIITEDSLAPAFSELCRWRELKGLTTKIVTTNEIRNTIQTPSSLHEKIKTCIYQHYIPEKDIQYVLLGGDVNIIPSRRCRRFLFGENYDIPSDLYYASFGGTFNWDSNNNHLYGETIDSIEYTHDVIIGRLCCRSRSDIIQYTQRLIQYESGYKNEYYDKLLLAGAMIDSDRNYEERQRSIDIYETCVAPFENVRMDYLFDTGSSIEGKTFNAPDLQDTFSEGYGVNIISSHGDKDAWLVDVGYFYTNNYAISLSSPATSIIMSSACNTNDFTSSQALSKAFIANHNSNVLCYYGNSSLGLWAKNVNADIGNQITRHFLSQIYQYKKPTIGLAYTDAAAVLYNQKQKSLYAKWTLLSMNLLGDPAMEISTNPMHKIGSIQLIRTEEGLRIISETDSINFNLIKHNGFDISHRHLYRNASECFFSSSELDNAEICLYKIGYIPFIIPENVVNSLLIGECTLTQHERYSSQHTELGTNSSSPLTINSTGNLEINTFGSVKVNGLSIQGGQLNIKRIMAE